MNSVFVPVEIENTGIVREPAEGLCNFSQTRLNKLVLSPQLKGENSASLSPWSIPYAALGSMLPTGGIGGDEKAHEIPNGNCLALSLSIFQVPFELRIRSLTVNEIGDLFE
jgi:hypothetical protein